MGSKTCIGYVTKVKSLDERTCTQASSIEHSRLVVRRSLTAANLHAAPAVEGWRKSQLPRAERAI
jgi:hypothetical protein